MAPDDPRRQLIVTTSVSLDGVMEAPDGEEGYRNSGWTFKDVEFVPEAYEITGREQEEAGALLLGAGKRLFSGADQDATKLSLVEHEVYANGVQKQIFDVIR